MLSHAALSLEFNRTFRPIGSGRAYGELLIYGTTYAAPTAPITNWGEHNEYGPSGTRNVNWVRPRSTIALRIW